MTTTAELAKMVEAASAELRTLTDAELIDSGRSGELFLITALAGSYPDCRYTVSNVFVPRGSRELIIEYAPRTYASYQDAAGDVYAAANGYPDEDETKPIIDRLERYGDGMDPEDPEDWYNR